MKFTFDLPSQHLVLRLKPGDFYRHVLKDEMIRIVIPVASWCAIRCNN